MHSLGQGESPYASHGFFTQYLDDDNPVERKLGIEAGLRWAKNADFIAYYLDLGLSNGMRYALVKHAQAERKIEARLLSKGELCFSYTNHRGELDRRSVHPHFFYWGKTEYHPKEQVLMTAFCLDRNEDRRFCDR